MHVALEEFNLTLNPSFIISAEEYVKQMVIKNAKNYTIFAAVLDISRSIISNGINIAMYNIHTSICDP